MRPLVTLLAFCFLVVAVKSAPAEEETGEPVLPDPMQSLETPELPKEVAEILLEARTMKVAEEPEDRKKREARSRNTCRDSFGDECSCRYWKAVHSCEYDFVHNDCEKTCGLCQSTEEEECKDYLAQPLCDRVKTLCGTSEDIDTFAGACCNKTIGGCVVDIDGCDPNPCDANAACADVPAPGTGQVCTCNTGYEGDGYTCTDIDGCAGDPCDANAACADVPAPGTGQVCTCNTGYVGDGYTCTDIDGCAGNPCNANAACADVPAPGTGQVCTCNTGYEGDGHTCTGGEQDGELNVRYDQIFSHFMNTMCAQEARRYAKKLKAEYDASSPKKYPLIHSSRDERTWAVDGKNVVHGESLYWTWSQAPECTGSSKYKNPIEAWYAEKSDYERMRGRGQPVSYGGIRRYGHFSQVLATHNYTLMSTCILQTMYKITHC
uniref:ShKT domain-containing protein n=1 Tax=Branchiostoma floridae TaxID=7739 RepID=C3YIP7_BRAFL|eukprot:XP_002603760.1 hypothetical protein BRAFLDRAFT_86588 [Branchiostoma floridae]